MQWGNYISMKIILKMLELVKHFLARLPFLPFLAVTVIQEKTMSPPTKMYLQEPQGNGRRYVDFSELHIICTKVGITIQINFTFCYGILFRISGYFIVASVFASD